VGGGVVGEGGVKGGVQGESCYSKRKVHIKNETLNPKP